QDVHHSAVGPLNRRPQLDPLRPPLVQLPAPLTQTLRRVRHRTRGELRPALVDDPDRMRLIRPIDSEVVAHWFASFGLRTRGRGARTAGCPYTGPRGGNFLLNLQRRSLADRDSLGLSLRGFQWIRSSGQQAPGRHAWPPLLLFLVPFVSWQARVFSPDLRLRMDGV